MSVHREHNTSFKQSVIFIGKHSTPSKYQTSFKIVISRVDPKVKLRVWGIIYIL